MTYSIAFTSDHRGFGNLRLLNGDVIELEYDCRTGSIDQNGDLVNAIRPDTWYIIEPPESTQEVAMVITPGKGWKVRLWLKLGNSSKYERTHYLIHPDGNKPGTAGCLGLIKNDALTLKKKLEDIMQTQKIIPVHVNKGGLSSNASS